MKMMLRRLAIVVCVALALLSAAYAFAVLRTHSGTGFWKVWLVLAVVFALLAIGIACHWWAALPRIIRGAIIAVVAIGIVAFCTIEGCIIGNMNAQGEPDLDYVIVLGAQVRESGPSKALRYRLDRTIDYLEENPDTICIVSGGQGHNEPFSEAQGMADYLQKHEIAENRIIQESKSESTMENIVNSKKLMRQENASVGIVTMIPHLSCLADRTCQWSEAGAGHRGNVPRRTCWSTIWSVSSSPKSNSCSHKRQSAFQCPSSLRKMRAARQPFLLRQGCECGPLFRSGTGRVQPTLEAGPFRVGFQQSSEQYGGGVSVA